MTALNLLLLFWVSRPMQVSSMIRWRFGRINFSPTERNITMHASNRAGGQQAWCHFRPNEEESWLTLEYHWTQTGIESYSYSLACVRQFSKSQEFVSCEVWQTTYKHGYEKPACKKGATTKTMMMGSFLRMNQRLKWWNRMTWAGRYLLDTILVSIFKTRSDSFIWTL